MTVDKVSRWPVMIMAAFAFLWIVHRASVQSITLDEANTLTRRYSTFIKVPAGVKIMKSASGPSDEDYHWMEVMMRDAGRHFNSIGLHYYTIANNWTNKGSATVFEEAEYAKTLQQTLRTDGIITRHAAIMDKYDRDKKVWLAVDEWGTWFDTEPGTNPGFLYQQNTLRDALVAALNINVFIKHADRVKMANIAQMINVLQAMILTKEDKMVLTPTYHVFEMFKSFQDATALAIDVKSPWYGKDGSIMPAISASAVRDKDGRLHVALVNVDPNHAVSVAAKIPGAATVTSASVLTAPAINSHNTFDQPAAVKPAAFSGAAIQSGVLKLAEARPAVEVDCGRRCAIEPAFWTQQSRDQRERVKRISTHLYTTAPAAPMRLPRS